MFERRDFLKAVAVLPFSAARLPAARFGALASGVPRVMSIPAGLSILVSRAVVVPVAGGAAYVFEIKHAYAVAPLALLIGLASGWAFNRIGSFLRQDQGITHVANESDIFHDRAGGAFGLVTPAARPLAPTDINGSGAVMRIRADGRTTLDEGAAQRPYADLSDDEALVLTSVGGPLKSIVPWSARIPPDAESRERWQSVLEKARATGQNASLHAEYTRVFANRATGDQRLLIASASGDTGRTIVLSPRLSL